MENQEDQSERLFVSLWRAESSLRTALDELNKGRSNDDKSAQLCIETIDRLWSTIKKKLDDKESEETA